MVVQPVAVAHTEERPTMSSEGLMRLDKFTKFFPIHFSGAPSEDPQDYLDRCHERDESEGKVSSLLLWKEKMSLTRGGKKSECAYIEKALPLVLNGLERKIFSNKIFSTFSPSSAQLNSSAVYSLECFAVSPSYLFTSENPPVPAADMLNNEKVMIVAAWKHTDFLCKGYILSALEDNLYNAYCAMNTSKEIWDALEKQYKTEDACLKMFVVAMFLDYKMIDNKIVGTQVQELQLIFHDLIAEGMFPPSWRDFKNYLKHRCKETKLKDLVIRLKIEEDDKTAEMKSRGISMIRGANIVDETAPKSKKRKRSFGYTKEQNKKKFKGTYYNWGKASHKTPDCRLRKRT
ncbi:uncharacterized protein [Nicotiana tomentosiformis]|uniref:uncharacterized protein n=1 Tax=Nicotiana tomentosiformis TaxID=4098 RepID=UPI00388C9141